MENSQPSIKSSTVAATLQTVLVADDDKAILSLISTVLEQVGYRVFSADSGSQFTLYLPPVAPPN